MKITEVKDGDYIIPIKDVDYRGIMLKKNVKYNVLRAFNDPTRYKNIMFLIGIKDDFIRLDFEWAKKSLKSKLKFTSIKEERIAKINEIFS